MIEKPNSVIWALGNAQKATEPAIDAALAWFYGQQERPEAQLAHAKSQLKPLQERAEKIAKGIPVKGYQTARDGVMLMKAITGYEGTIAHAEKLIAELEAAAAPLHAEYRRRGGWNRYFLALTDSQDGHVHRSMSCQTCNREGKATRFGWMTDFSGRAERTLTDQIGPTACTVCFPWAETIRIEADKAAKEAKAAEKAAVAAEKARVAAEKGITTPEGGKVITGRYSHSWDVAKTLRTAEIALTDAIYDLIREQQHRNDPAFAWMYEDDRRNPDKEERDCAYLVWHLARAIAFKKGLTFAEVMEVHTKKADAKIRKADRDWAKEPRNPNRAK